MSEKISGKVSTCPYDSGPRYVFLHNPSQLGTIHEHSVTWRVTCAWCGRSWRYSHPPTTPAELNPPPPFLLWS